MVVKPFTHTESSDQHYLLYANFAIVKLTALVFNLENNAI